jgi:hypothetical protein
MAARTHTGFDWHTLAALEHALRDVQLALRRITRCATRHSLQSCRVFPRLKSGLRNRMCFTNPRRVNSSTM